MCIASISRGGFYPKNVLNTLYKKNLQNNNCIYLSSFKYFYFYLLIISLLNLRKFSD